MAFSNRSPQPPPGPKKSFSKAPADSVRPPSASKVTLKDLKMLNITVQRKYSNATATANDYREALEAHKKRIPEFILPTMMADMDFRLADFQDQDPENQILFIGERQLSTQNFIVSLARYGATESAPRPGKPPRQNEQTSVDIGLLMLESILQNMARAEQLNQTSVDTTTPNQPYLAISRLSYSWKKTLGQRGQDSNAFYFSATDDGGVVVCLKTPHQAASSKGLPGATKWTSTDINLPPICGFEAKARTPARLVKSHAPQISFELLGYVGGRHEYWAEEAAKRDPNWCKNHYKCTDPACAVPFVPAHTRKAYLIFIGGTQMSRWSIECSKEYLTWFFTGVAPPGTLSTPGVTIYCDVPLELTNDYQREIAIYMAADTLHSQKQLWAPKNHRFKFDLIPEPITFAENVSKEYKKKKQRTS